MTLEEFLEINLSFVEREAPKVASGKDLPPMLSYIDPKGHVTVVTDFEEIWGAGLDKDLMMALVRAKLREAGAQMYALVSAAWFVSRRDPKEAEEVERVMLAEGTGGRYRDERTECYMVSVGDRERSLLGGLGVTRDWKGKIRKLTRSAQADGMSGRMVNLLREVQ